MRPEVFGATCFRPSSLRRRCQAAYVEMERAAERHRPSCGGFAWCDVSLPLEKRPLVKCLRCLVNYAYVWFGVGWGRGNDLPVCLQTCDDVHVTLLLYLLCQI